MSGDLVRRGRRPLSLISPKYKGNLLESLVLNILIDDFLFRLDLQEFKC